MAFGPDNRYTPGQPAGGWINQPQGHGYGAAPAADAASIDAGLRAYMLRVFNWMTSGLLLTGIVALFVVSSPEITSLFWQRTMTPRGAVVSATILGWAAILSPLAFVLVLTFGINRLSRPATQGLFWLFAVAMGLSISNIFLRYTGQSISSTFFITAGTFAAMSLWGYTTQRDLTKMGSFLMMGLIGIIIASVVNIFLGSGMMSFIIAVLGVLIFTGLTAWDTQRIKTDYIEHAYADGPDQAGKRSVMDALGLYLNFINLFQFLLQLIGVRQSD